MKKKNYYHLFLKEKDKQFYSLNFLFAKIIPLSKNKKLEKSPIITIEKKYNGKNIVIEKYYKNISTIYEIPQSNEDR